MESANWLNGRVRKSVTRNRIGGIVTPQMRMPSSATVRTALTLSSSPPHVLPGEQIRHGGSTERQALTGIHDHDIVVEIRRQILIREDLAGIHHDRQRANGRLRAAVKHDMPEAQLEQAVVLHKAAGMTGAKSIETLRNTYKAHILPYLKGVPLKKVTPMQIQLILGNLSGQSKSLNDKAIQILRGIFNAAVDNNLIAKSPVPLRLRSGGIATKEKAALTVEQSRQLLNAVFGTRAYLFCLIALQTGMRRGEICGLMWSDIDFDAQIIHVQHNAIFSSEQTVVSSDLKTAAARRDIPIPPTLLALLTSEKNGSESPFVLHMDNGSALSQTSFSNLWDMVRRRTVNDAAELGTPARNSKMVRSLDFHVTPHQLRHTYITRLFESGLDIKEIQYLAGHTTIDMTLRVYTHYQHESRKKETAKKVCEALG